MSSNSVRARFGSPSHLLGRFAGSLSRIGPTDRERAFVAQLLRPSELALWEQMGPSDQRHGLAVAEGVGAWMGYAPHTVPAEALHHSALVAGLLHDVGKITSRLGPLGRSVATGLALGLGDPPWPGPGWVTGWATNYLDHARIGGELLRAAGSDQLVVDWAAGHDSGPPWPPTVPADLAHVLHRFDNA